MMDWYIFLNCLTAILKKSKMLSRWARNYDKSTGIDDQKRVKLSRKAALKEKRAAQPLKCLKTVHFTWLFKSCIR